jgi:hypothetical protein
MSNHSRETQKSPEWTRYWRDLVIYPSESCYCCLCTNPIGRKQAAIKNRGNLYCSECSGSLYEVVRQKLQELETQIHEQSSALGHSLGSFQPANLGSIESGVLIAYCRRCRKSVCYNVVDMIRDWNRAYQQPIILYNPMGFPLLHRCRARF